MILKNTDGSISIAILKAKYHHLPTQNISSKFLDFGNPERAVD